MKLILWPVIHFLLPKRTTAISIWPFILYKDKSKIDDKIINNHEQIHLKQQVELFLIFFYIIYILEYLFNLIRYRNSNQAYLAISFEREAYNNDRNLKYPNTRKSFAMWRS